MRKLFLLVALLSSAPLTAQTAPPTNVMMENGQFRAVTPAATYCYTAGATPAWAPCPVASATGGTTTTAAANSVTVFTASVNSVRAVPTRLTAWAVSVATTGTAGCVVVYDSAAALAAGATFTTTLVRWTAFVGAGTTVPMQYAQPLAMTNGLQIVFTSDTTCKTYTVPTTAPVSITGAWQ